MRLLTYLGTLIITCIFCFQLNAQYEIDLGDLEVDTEEVEEVESRVVLKMTKDPEHNMVYLQFKLVDFQDLASISWLKVRFQVASYPNNNTLWMFNGGLEDHEDLVEVTPIGDNVFDIKFYNMELYAKHLNGDNYMLGKTNMNTAAVVGLHDAPDDSDIQKIVVVIGGNYCDTEEDAQSVDDTGVQSFSSSSVHPYCSSCNNLFQADLVYGRLRANNEITKPKAVSPQDITTDEDCDKGSNSRFLEAPSEELNVYPNPANQELVISGTNNIEEIHIVSLSGQLIKLVKDGIDYEYRMDVADLQPGVYFAKFKQENGAIETKKFSILR